MLLKVSVFFLFQRWSRMGEMSCDCHTKASVQTCLEGRTSQPAVRLHSAAEAGFTCSLSLSLSLACTFRRFSLFYSSSTLQSFDCVDWVSRGASGL